MGGGWWLVVVRGMRGLPKLLSSLFRSSPSLSRPCQLLTQECPGSFIPPLKCQNICKIFPLFTLKIKKVQKRKVVPQKN